MRWQQLLLPISLLWAGGFAAKKSSAERFNDFHAKALSSSPVKLTDTTYKTITTAPRDYSAAVLLTALESRFQCQLCREFQPEWDLLAKSWTKGDKAGQSRLVFGTLDFSDGKDTFLSLSLQTAPVLLVFLPTTGPHAAASPEPLRYDFTSGAQTAEQVHLWLSRHLPDRPHPPIKRPINWMRWITTGIIVLGTATALTVAWPYVLPIIQSRNLWAIASIFAILFFTSGIMFNHIRKVPYIAGDGRGGISYFAGGFQNQFGLETQIIAALYGLLSFATIWLALRAPRTSDPKLQQLSVLIWGGIMLVFYSLLLSVFRVKNAGYPFRLPPFM